MRETIQGEKAIQHITIGDQVLAKDENTGALAFKEVEWLYEREVDEVYQIHIGHEVLETTDEHPFWIVGEVE
ncbi:hypothetical protein CEN49_24265 [Fischerella thermalis CCMEE 5273]|nr:hypothetical protein CEN49_24265 [Fischerella thermalis CCMEE 5273]